MKKIRVFKVEKLKMVDIPKNETHEHKYIGQDLEIYNKDNEVFLFPFNETGMRILDSSDFIVEDYYGNEWKVIDGKLKMITEKARA